MGRSVGSPRWVFAAMAVALLSARTPDRATGNDCACGACACGDSVCDGNCASADCGICGLLGGGPPGCYCGSLVTPLGGCASGFESIWVRAEFLALKRDGVALPALATTSEVADGAARGSDSTTVLAGEQAVGNDWRLGFQLELGYWLNPESGWCLGGDYLYGGRDAYSFRIGPDSTRILGRPFFNTQENAERALIFNDPITPGGRLSGWVSGTVFDDFQSAGAWTQKRIGLWGSPCSSGGGSTISVLGGYRYYHHDSLIFIHQQHRIVDGTNLPPETPPDDTQAFGSEKFAGRNEFHGGEIGLQGRIQRRRLWCDGLAAVAFGGAQRVVFVEGNTLFIDPLLASNNPPNVEGGVLLTSSETNLGRYADNKFQAVPRFRIGAGCQFNEWLGFRAGYNLVIWDIVQAADHLPPDLQVDPRNVPIVAGIPGGGGEAPAFPGILETTMVSHGLDLGLELSF
jgi:hypothetical protein